MTFKNSQLLVIIIFVSCPFSFNIFLVNIGYDYKTCSPKIVEEDFYNTGVPPQGHQVPSQGNQVLPQEQTPIFPPTMTDVGMRSAFLTLAQHMDTQAQEVATQVQAVAI